MLRSVEFGRFRVNKIAPPRYHRMTLEEIEYRLRGLEFELSLLLRLEGRVDGPNYDRYQDCLEHFVALRDEVRALRT